jgi:hypothetical protein
MEIHKREEDLEKDIMIPNKIKKKITSFSK